jgi:hypothetical protein
MAKELSPIKSKRMEEKASLQVRLLPLSPLELGSY